jgi:hypothetical protein
MCEAARASGMSRDCLSGEWALEEGAAGGGGERVEGGWLSQRWSWSGGLWLSCPLKMVAWNKLVCYKHIGSVCPCTLNKHFLSSTVSQNSMEQGWLPQTVFFSLQASVDGRLRLLESWTSLYWGISLKGQQHLIPEVGFQRLVITWP